MVQFRVKYGAATNMKNVGKTGHFHNAKLLFFGTKNTISCGCFNLPTKPVVFEKRPSQSVCEQIQLAFWKRKL